MWKLKRYTHIESTQKAYAFTTGMGYGPFRLNEREDLENYQKLAAELGSSPDRMVRVAQKHTDNILIADESCAGQGVTAAAPEGYYDGIITNTPGLIISVVTADCVPVFVLDPVNNAAAVIHSSRVCTAAGISVKALDMMKREYGTKASDVKVLLGPYICGSCYEVGEEVLGDFDRLYTEEEKNSFIRKKRGDKYCLDLGQAILLQLLKAGISQDRYMDTSLCTNHGSDFWSWRRTGDKLGRNVSGIMLL